MQEGGKRIAARWYFGDLMMWPYYEFDEWDGKRERGKSQEEDTSKAQKVDLRMFSSCGYPLRREGYATQHSEMCSWWAKGKWLEEKKDGEETYPSHPSVLE